MKEVTYSHRSEPVETCLSCWKAAKDSVACENLHLMCRKCARAWFYKAPHCPTCKISIDLSSVFSLRERAIIWLKDLSEHYQKAVLDYTAPIALFSSLFSVCVLGGLKGWGTVPGVILGSLAGIEAARIARIEKREAAFVAAMIITTSFVSVLDRTIWNDSAFDLR